MTGPRLFNVERYEWVLAALRRHGSVRVRELARDLGVSELTIRRDITALAQRNLVTKVHGGAMLPTPAGPAGRPRPAETTFIIGMVVPSLDVFWPPVVSGARAAAAALGVTIQLRGSSYDPDEDRRQISRLVEAGQVQGLLLAPSLRGADATRMIGWIGSLAVPAVLVERAPSRWVDTGRPLEWVSSDHALGLEMAVHHLHGQGHRQIGLMLCSAGPTSGYLEHGWRAACADLGPSDATLVTLAAGQQTAVPDILAECRRANATALVVHGNATAIARGCADLGLSIPDDLAVVSYDDETAQLEDPTLTVVRSPKNHVGRLAVELLVSRLLDGARRPAQRVLVAPELVVRQSSLARAGRPR